MDMNKFVELMITDLTRDKLFLEEELTRTINTGSETITKIEAVKKLLNQLVINEITLKKFLSMVHNETSKKQ
jgi:predicted metal-dependent enzyme (double-stranded beta helix superfamily)